MSDVIVGADPGFSGGLAAITPTHTGIHILDAIAAPVRTLPTGKVYEPVVAMEWLEKVAPGIIVLERAHAMPKQGVSAVFSYGRSFGALEAVALLQGCRVTWVSPAKWKRALRLPADKGAAMDLASVTYGERALRDYWPRKKDNGVAEAALIALWWHEHGRHGR